MNFSWIPEYSALLLQGIWTSLLILATSIFFGMLIAVPVALAQVAGGFVSRNLAKGFTTVIRGTPLLVQVYLLYYGLGDLFGRTPEIRDSFLWPFLREGYWYAVAAISISVGAYEGEVLRGAFLAVPRGELEAAEAFGMPSFTRLRRIWLPRAVQIVLPTLSGESVLTLKSTSLASLITVMDLMGVATRIRMDTYRIYEPLLLAAAIYVAISLLIALLFRLIERRTSGHHRPNQLF